MRTFKCNQCDNESLCVLTVVETANAPVHCPFPSDSGDTSASWKEFFWEEVSDHEDPTD